MTTSKVPKALQKQLDTVPTTTLEYIPLDIYKITRRTLKDVIRELATLADIYYEDSILLIETDRDIDDDLNLTMHLVNTIPRSSKDIQKDKDQIIKRFEKQKEVDKKNKILKKEAELKLLEQLKAKYGGPTAQKEI